MLDHVWSLHELEVGQSWELIQLWFKTSESAVDQHLESPTLTVTNGSSSTTGLYVSHIWYTLQCVLDQQVPRSLLTWHFSMSASCCCYWYLIPSLYCLSYLSHGLFLFYFVPYFYGYSPLVSQFFLLLILLLSYISCYLPILSPQMLFFTLECNDLQLNCTQFLSCSQCGCSHCCKYYPDPKINSEHL